MEPTEQRVLAALDALGVARETLVVAVSGGLDSTALLHLLAAVATERDIGLVVGHVDHGLRGAESEGDRKCVEAQAASLGLACEVVRIDVDAARRDQRNRTRPSVQEAARQLRYRALDDIAARAGSRRIATAHHLDDQAETVLLRLLRGTSPDGLAGIPEASRDGRIVRPLLSLRRAELEAYARAGALRWREDASNQDTHYARNRLRLEALPALEQAFNPNLVSALGRLAESQRRDREWLEPLVERAFEQTFRVVEENRLESVETAWQEHPEGLARRLVARAIQHLGGGRNLDRRQLDRALDFLRAGPGAPGGREIELPSPLRLRREQGRLVFYLAASQGRDPGASSARGKTTG
ncbi:MAG: tRNA lysidine(34) synthetase TilS [Myxococcota bacterium]|jgi:tRNA(Ile)-lysidine synthase|nr:tRNA lysidine(34) synthetase TilS [Myxococcota bacterium]